MRICAALESFRVINGSIFGKKKVFKGKCVAVAQDEWRAAAVRIYLGQDAEEEE